MSISHEFSASNLWETLSKDVCSQAREERNSLRSNSIMEENCESQLLLETGSKKQDIKKYTAKGSNWVMTAFLLVNTALGIGILNFPAAYNQAGGILYATGLQLVMLALMMSTMFILAYCSDVNGDKTYHDVLLSMCGRRGQQLAAVSITITLYCVCVAILIIIGDQMDSLFHSVFGPSFCSAWYLQRRFTISATAIIFILPACYCKRVDFLACIGSVGIFAMLYPVFLTVYGYLKYDVVEPDIKNHPDNISSMFAVMPILGLGYQCQEVVVPVYACMRERNLCNFMKSSFLAMGFLFVIYSVIGCFGYLTFGSNVAHNVMKMYNADDPVVMVGVGALIIKMIVTYPILALCGRDAAAGIYAELIGLKPLEFVKTEKKRRYAFASIWFVSSLLLAVLTSGIGIVIKYLGSVASANIFIYPGICLMRVVMKEDPDLEKCRSRVLVGVAVFISAFGAFCVGVVLLQAILDNSTESHTFICDRQL